MALLILGLVVFLGIHSVRIFAPDWRLALIGRMGDGRWKGLYTLVSLAGIVLIVLGYDSASETADQLFIPPSFSRALILLVMPVALALFVASNFGPGYLKRLVRHPLLIATMLWSAAHIIANGDSASMVMFGAFFVWAILCLFSSAKRGTTLSAKTRVWPDLVSIAVAIIITWGLLAGLHEWLFGVAIV